RDCEPDEDLLETAASVGRQVGEFLQRRLAEEAVYQSEARKAAVLEAAQDAIITLEYGGEVIEWNAGAERIFGHAAAAALGKDLAELILPADARAGFRQALASCSDEGKGRADSTQAEGPALRADGTAITVEWALARIRTDGAPMV